MTGILDHMRTMTPETLANVRTDFDDLPTPVYVSRRPKDMVRIVEGADDLKVNRPAPKNPGMVKAQDWGTYPGEAGHNGQTCNGPCCDDAPAPAPVRTRDGRSPRQVETMTGLLDQLEELDHELSLQARIYTANMTEHGRWTPGREGTASVWIGNMIRKVRELKARPVAPVEVKLNFDHFADITDGNYAIVREGKTHFYRVTRKVGKGQYAGRTFIKLQERASESLFRVEGPWPVRKAILNAIREAGVTASHLLYSSALSRCWHCNITLTDDHDNPYHAHGLGPVCGPKVMG
jgi:hypothetical protein